MELSPLPIFNFSFHPPHKCRLSSYPSAALRGNLRMQSIYSYSGCLHKENHVDFPCWMLNPVRFPSNSTSSQVPDNHSSTFCPHEYVLQGLHRSGITQYLSFRVWFISLSITSSWFTCVVAGARSSFLSKAEEHSVVWRDAFCLSIYHPSVDKSCVRFSAVANNASLSFRLV